MLRPYARLNTMRACATIHSAEAPFSLASPDRLLIRSVSHGRSLYAHT